MNFSILIPSMEDLPYLKLCLESLNDNSVYEHEVCIVCVDDDVYQFLLQNLNSYKNLKLLFIFPEKRELNEKYRNNVSKAYNTCFSLSNNDYIIVADSDHVYPPMWDKHIEDSIKPNCIISIHRIEDRKTYGESPEGFKKEKFYKEYQNYIKKEFIKNDAFHPFIITREMWEAVNGMNETFIGALHDDFFWKELYKKYNCTFLYSYESNVFHFSGRNKPDGLQRTNLTLQEEWAKVAPKTYEQICGYPWIPVQDLHKYNIEDL